MSPHRAAHVIGSERLRMADLAVLLNKAAEGSEIPDQVNVQRGY
jgi:hypothetical protein